MKVDSFSEDARRTPNPPAFIGRLACIHWSSDKLTFAIWQMLDLSNSSVWGIITLSWHGEHRKRCWIQAVLKEHRKINRASWADIVLRLTESRGNSSNFLFNVSFGDVSSKSGAPRRQALVGLTKMKLDRKSDSLSISDAISSLLEMFKMRLTFSPNCLTNVTSSFTVDTVPPSVMSSMKPTISSLDNDSNSGCRVTQKRRRPRGSPCCKPSCDDIVQIPYRRIEEWLYDRRRTFLNLQYCVVNSLQHSVSM